MCLNDYQISAYIDGILSEEEKKKAELHLNSCSECFEKAFFLRKTLAREEIYLKQNESMPVARKIKIWIENQNLRINEIIGQVKAKSLALSYRNQNVKKQTVAIELNGLEMIVEKSDQEIEIHFLNEGELLVQEQNGRIMFEGDIHPESRIYIPEQKIYILKSGGEEILLEFGIV